MKIVALILVALLAVPAYAAEPAHKPVIFRINFNTEVSEKAADQLQVAFMLVAAFKPDAVLMTINTPGGDVNSGWRIVHLIRNSPVPVHCLVDGQAASMGFVMLQACTTRGMTGESRLLAHQPYVRFPAETTLHINDIKSLLNAMVTMSEQLDVMCSARMGMTVEEYQAKTNSVDWWLSSISAMKNRAVDYVATDAATVRSILELNGTLPGAK